MKKANYEALTTFLKQLPDSQKTITLTHNRIEKIMGAFPQSLKNHFGITQKSNLGKAILKAGFVFNNSYSKHELYLTKNKETADAILKAKDTNKITRKQRIIINIVFPQGAGYLSTKGNIGHEIIDIFGADNNRYYYYINPWGLVDDKNVPDVVISICQASTGLYKILNKAVVDKPEKLAVAKKNTGKDLLTGQKKKFKYNDKFLEDYFEENAGDNMVLCSLDCKGIYEPKTPIYFVFDAFKQSSPKKGFYRLVSVSTGRTTKFVHFNQSDQLLLEQLVNDKKIWKDEPIKSFKEYARSYETKQGFNYFKELGIDKQELQYSNALKFFLNEYNLTNSFLKKIGCSISENEKFNIEREEYNIDLLFTNFDRLDKPKNTNNERIVVIENKIKADITPTDEDKTLPQQVEKVFKHIYEINQVTQLNQEQKNKYNEICRYLHAEGEEKTPSQLSKYYIYSVILAMKRGWSKSKIEKDIRCYFLCPKYSEALYETNKEGYLVDNTFVGDNRKIFLQEKYKLITYKDILPVFKKGLDKAKNNKHKYFLEDFIGSIEEQSKDRDDSLEQNMIKMFYLRSKRK